MGCRSDCPPTPIRYSDRHQPGHLVPRGGRGSFLRDPLLVQERQNEPLRFRAQAPLLPCGAPTAQDVRAKLDRVRESRGRSTQTPAYGQPGPRIPTASLAWEQHGPVPIRLTRAGWRSFSKPLAEYACRRIAARSHRRRSVSSSHKTSRGKPPAVFSLSLQAVMRDYAAEAHRFIDDFSFPRY
jgi:hypothetical protein